MKIQRFDNPTPYHAFVFLMLLWFAGGLSCGKNDEPGPNTCEVIDQTPDIAGWRESRNSPNYVPAFTRYQFLNKNDGYALGGTLVHSVDGGTNWEDVPGFTRPEFGNLREMSVLDHDRIFVVADTFPPGGGSTAQILIRTSNGGQSWETLAVGDYTLVKIAFRDVLNGFGFGYDDLGNGPVFIRTADGGASWSAVPGVSFPNVYSELLIEWRNPNLGLVQIGREFAYLTTDGGLNWKKIAVEPADVSSYYLVDANTLFALGNNRSAYSTDGGLTWTSTDPEQVFVLTIDGNNGLGIALQPDCPDIQPGHRAFATSSDGGKTWTRSNPLATIPFFNRQEITPGLCVYYDTGKNIFYWFEKE
ncbi:MAG: hypothetical protein IPJ82_12600 [Lewinellaceae bacterium]|nr:hypothetical protein [Lewinellaceae bacterium]